MGNQSVCLVSSHDPLGCTLLACLFESTSPAHPSPSQGVPQRCGVGEGRPPGAQTDQRRFRCRTRDRPIAGAVVCHGGQPAVARPRNGGAHPGGHTFVFPGTLPSLSRSAAQS